MDKSLGPRFGPYRLGQVVLSRRGKDRGNLYVVVGFPEEDRLALADADRFNVSRPKRKNPKHVQPTSLFAAEVAEWVRSGRDIDRGRFCQILNALDGDALNEKRSRNGEAG